MCQVDHLSYHIFFFFNDTATTEIYTLSLHDALPILPPLVLHAFVSSSAAKLRDWAHQIGPVSPTATWFNFLASHDGIGLRPTEGILDDGERAALVDRVLEHGGRVGLSVGPDGAEKVYELNLTYLDALCTTVEAADPAVLVAKGLAAHSILLAVVGVPAIYVHSLLGTPPDLAGMQESGISRRVNRPALDARSEEHTSELQSRQYLVCRLLL